MLNNWSGTGRLVADPQLQHTHNGTAVVSVTIACDRDVKKEDGTRETDFIDVTAWRGDAEFLSKYFTKGAMVTVTGRLAIESYTDKDGIKRKASKIVADGIYFGESKRRDDSQSTAPAQSALVDDYSEIDIPDGEVPF